MPPKKKVDRPTTENSALHHSRPQSVLKLTDMQSSSALRSEKASLFSVLLASSLLSMTPYVARDDPLARCRTDAMQFVHITDLSGRETISRVTGGMKVK
jgi:hypothetical protein